MISILVSSLATVVTSSDLGRYVAVQPFNGVSIPPNTEVEVFSRAGKTARGRVVNMRSEIQNGMFPPVSGMILDTQFAPSPARRIPMVKGGIAAMQSRKGK